MKSLVMELEKILTKEVIEEVYKEIHASSDWRRLAEKYNKLKMQGKIAQALIYAKKMKDFEVGAFEGVARRYFDREKMMRERVSVMSKEDRKQLVVLSYGTFLLSDVLETLILDINTLIMKYSESKTCGFDKLNEAVKEARKVVAHFDETIANEKASSMFGDCSDDLYKMIFNKASSYYNKLSNYEKEANKKAPRNAEVA